MSLVNRLRELQGEKSQTEFAAELGITQSLLSRLYSGERQIGLKVLQGIASRYPELGAEVTAFLMADNMTSEPSVKTPAA